MPPLPAVPGVVKAELQLGIGVAYLSGSRIFLQYTGSAPSNADMSTLAHGIDTAANAHLAALVPSGRALGPWTCTDLSSDSGAQSTYTGSGSGSRSGTGLDAGRCAVFNHQVARRYRGGKPRTYIPCGVTSDLAGENAFNSSFITAATGAWSAFVAEVLATSGLDIDLVNIVNVSYYNGYDTSTPPWRGPGYKYPPRLRSSPLIDQIVSTTVASKLGSQRRRLTG